MLLHVILLVGKFHPICDTTASIAAPTLSPLAAALVYNLHSTSSSKASCEVFHSGTQHFALTPPASFTCEASSLILNSNHILTFKSSTLQPE